MAQQRPAFYSRTPLWRRVVFALLIGVLSPPLGVFFLAIPDPSGLFELDPSSETFLFIGGLWVAMTLLMFVGALMMFEFWWKRHPPSWMTMFDDDGDETGLHEADYHG